MHLIDLKQLERISEKFSKSPKMPILFVGHGNPMNAIEQNQFSATWETIGALLPTPSAILCVSAHWLTRGIKVTYNEAPATIHDFGGFPKELHEVQYPAISDRRLSADVQHFLQPHTVTLDETWGYDHGSWSVLNKMYPQANIPVIQLSLDVQLSAMQHYELAKLLSSLRNRGVLIIGSGNMVHNLQRIRLLNNDFNTPYAFDWAAEANQLFKQYIIEGKHQELANYHTLGQAVMLSIPTPDHYWPMLYSLALQDTSDELIWFNDQIVGGSAGMTSFIYY